MTIQELNTIEDIQKDINDLKHYINAFSNEMILNNLNNINDKLETLK